MSETSNLATYARLLKLTPVEGIALQEIGGPRSELFSNLPDQKVAKSRWPTGTTSFLLLAVLPTCLAVLYFLFLAAPRYESEASFVLRSPGRSLPAGAQIATLLQSTGATRSNDDGYIVREFLESRDAVDYLKKNDNLLDALSHAGADPLWRFPSLLSRDTNEGLYRYFQRLMSASFDSTSGVSTLTVQAFSPTDAQRLVTGLLNAAESLVNRLNERARRDAVGTAEVEADRMRRRAVAAQTTLTAFRERQKLVDPSQVTLAVLEAIGKLSIEVSEVSVRLNELERASPNTPQLQVLRTRRTALERQISIERQRLAGDSEAIAPLIAEYETLMLEQMFAEKALVAAMTSVELARLESLRQQVYLERITMPVAPDYAAYPWAVIWSFVVFAIGCMTWRLWRSISADIFEHVR